MQIGVANENHLYKPWKHGGEAIGSRRSLAPANVGVTSLHLGRCAPPFGELKTFPKSFEGVQRELFQKFPLARPSHPPRLTDKPQFVTRFLSILPCSDLLDLADVDAVEIVDGIIAQHALDFHLSGTFSYDSLQCFRMLCSVDK